MNKRKNLTILVIVLVVSGCLGIGVIWFESSHRHGPSPTENISEYTEKDPEKALRLLEKIASFNGISNMRMN